MKIRQYILLLFFIVVATLLSAQAYNFNKLSIEDGLSQITINAIAQDSKGFLWFGTQDGLNRYDGLEFKIYKNIPFDETSLTENYIEALYGDTKGNLWVGTKTKGLQLYDYKRDAFIHFQHSENDSLSLSNNSITTIYEDNRGTVWVGTANGFNRVEINKDSIQSTKFHRHLYAENLQRGKSNSQYITSFYTSKNNELWVGTYKGVLRYKIEASKLELIATYLEEKEVFSVMEGADGNIWFGAYTKGLYQLNLEREVLKLFSNDEKNPKSLSNNYIRSITKDRLGNLLVGTSQGINVLKFEKGVYLDDFERYEQNNTTKSIHNNGVSKILQDKFHDDLYWVGTYLGGISRMSTVNKKFKTDYLDSPSIPQYVAPVVRWIWRDRYDVLWVGTDNGVVAKNEKTNKYKYYKTIYLNNKKEDFKSYHIRKIFRDRQGTGWACTHLGLLEFLPEKSGEYTANLYQSNVNDKAAICALEDENGIYIGTWSGINFFDYKTKKLRDETFVVDTIQSKTFGYQVKKLYRDSHDNFWIGTSAGLILYRNMKTSLFETRVKPEFYYHDKSNKKSLSSQAINDIIEDSYGNIWLATTNGLVAVKMEEKTLNFETFNEQDGLANSMVYSLLDDGKYLWMSTNKGLSRLYPSTRKFYNFDINDGLQSNEFNEGAVAKMPDGEMLFGGINGYTAFYPHEIRLDEQSPQVWLTQLSTFDNKSFNLLGGEKTIYLPHYQNTFSVQFIGLDYAYPNDIEYYYDLEGSDEQNVSIGNSRQVNFTKLPSGKYTLRIKAANRDGAINQKGDLLEIIIATPFWRSLWFYGLLALCSALLIWLVFYLRYRYKMAQVAEIERIRKNAAQDFHDELGSKLTIISMFSELTKSNLNGEAEAATPFIDKVIETSNSLYHSMKDLLWSLNPEQDAIQDLYFQLKDFGDDLYERTGVEFEAQGIDEQMEETLLPMEYKRHILLIFKELMNNSLKHSKASEVALKIFNDDTELRLKFEDNGIGFDIEEKTNGDGIKNMYSRADKIDGVLTIVSNKNGTKVTLVCKLKPPNFKNMKSKKYIKKPWLFSLISRGKEVKGIEL